MQRTTTTRRLQPIKRDTRPLFVQTLTTPATFCGTIDGSGDRARPTARTVCQAFGPYASAAYIEPMRESANATRAHRISTIVAIACGITVACALVAERFV